MSVQALWDSRLTVSGDMTVYLRDHLLSASGILLDT